MDPGPAFPFELLPEEVQERVLRYATTTRHDRLVNSLVSRAWREQVARFGVNDELWYGLNSTARLTSFLDPFELGYIKAGEFQEGPCRSIALRVVECLAQKYGHAFEAFPSCMLGVLYTECGKVMITLSGTLSLRRPEGKQKREALFFANKQALKGQALVVVAGAVGVVDDETGVLCGATVRNFRYQYLNVDYHPVGEEGGESANTIPGSCALPKLLAACLVANVVPRWVAEVLIRPRSGAKGLKLLGPGGVVQTYHHGDVAPSCLNCRRLVPDMLVGIATFRDAIRQQQHDSEERKRFLIEQAQRRYQLEEQARATNEERQKARLAEALARAEERCLLVKGCVQVLLGDELFEQLVQPLDVLFGEYQSEVAAVVEKLEPHIEVSDVLGNVLAKRFVKIVSSTLLRSAFTRWKGQQPKQTTKKAKKRAPNPVEEFGKLWPEGKEPFDPAVLLLAAISGSGEAPGLEALIDLTDFDDAKKFLEKALLQALDLSFHPQSWDPEKPEG